MPDSSASTSVPVEIIIEKQNDPVTKEIHAITRYRTSGEKPFYEISQVCEYCFTSIEIMSQLLRQNS